MAASRRERSAGSINGESSGTLELRDHGSSAPRITVEPKALAADFAWGARPAQRVPVAALADAARTPPPRRAQHRWRGRPRRSASPPRPRRPSAASGRRRTRAGRRAARRRSPAARETLRSAATKWRVSSTYGERVVGAVDHEEGRGVGVDAARSATPSPTARASSRAATPSRGARETAPSRPCRGRRGDRGSRRRRRTARSLAPSCRRTRSRAGTRDRWR